ncbi:MAG: GNAT family N-acetyltransferase [Ignavibacteria bacterium]|nr:GNAT family N-acetyltransferase [Ignavibacteria bacterium]
MINISEFFGSLPQLETSRVKLRKIDLFDTQDIYEYASNPQVSEYLFWDTHKSPITSRKFISNIMQCAIEGRECPWGIEFKETSKIIGTAGFNFCDTRNKKAEIGYALSPQYWNKGIMTEIVNLITVYGFKYLALNRIEARCELENIASHKVLEKCGYTKEGILRQAAFAKGKFKDLYLYAIISSEEKSEML